MALKVGGLTETVQVLAETPLIDIGSTTRHRNIPAEEFDIIGSVLRTALGEASTAMHQ